MWIQTFIEAIRPKVNATARLKFELTFHDVVVHNVATTAGQPVWGYFMHWGKEIVRLILHFLCSFLNFFRRLYDINIPF